MSSTRPTPAERALAAAIFAPIGLGAKIVDDLPTAVTKVRQQLVFARFIGKIAVDQGVTDLRSRWESVTSPRDDSSAPTTAPPSRSRDSLPATSALPGTSAQAEAAAASTAPPPNTLALPDYDQLPAAHIVGKLAGLTAAELGAIEAYETAGRHRRTVLGKISQLRET